MKKIFFLLTLALSLFFTSTVLAVEHIEQYDVNLDVQENGDLLVEEKIKYDFDNLERHGIYRTIPVAYTRDGKKFTLRISDVSVTDESGKKYQFQILHPQNQIEIKIGDKDVLITGVHKYILKYHVEKPVVFGNEFDRLSWNAIGTEWTIPINAVTIDVELSRNFENKILKMNCYRGVYGSAQSCGQGSVQKLGAQFQITTLGENRGLTIDIDFKKGTVAPPTKQELFWEQIKKWAPVMLPILTFIFLFFVWHKKGRDPKGRGTIVTQFDAPSNLTPAEVGTLIDENAADKDVFAEIIYLATKGYLKIFKEEKKGWFGSEEYIFTRLKGDEEMENEFDKELLRGIFADGTVSAGILKESVKMSELKNKFYKTLGQIKKDIYTGMTSKGYFKENPWKTKLKFAIPGVVILCFSFYIVGAIEAQSAQILWIWRISIFVTAVLFFIFAPFMPARTQKGVDAKEHILGLKTYLTVAEKDRLNFHNAPEKNPATFEKLLPFAMALGVETAWAKQFADMIVQPSWYGSSTGSALNAVAFTSGMSNFSSVAKSNMASSPSSGGGGGSGGGFGGGGGGSW